MKIRNWYLVALVALLFGGACASQPDAHVCASGIICPAPLECAAVQAVCITNKCGNGIVDTGELCDDGNIVDGDGCSHDCLSIEMCGNGVKDPGEDCDDMNTHDGKCDDGSPCNVGDTCPTGVCHGDGCSHDCKSQGCGNDRLDPGEICDDGGTSDGKCMDGSPCGKTMPCATGKCMPDGCSADCLSKEVCGNGIVDLGEVCDDGNTVSGDSCESDCQSGTGCGNGIIDPNEECDDGNQVDTDDCHNNCKVNVCGDGVRDITGTSHHEDCDPGSGGVPLETANCNIDCTTPTCGDGKINPLFMPDGVHGEQCDDPGNNDDMKDCTSHCLINVCGDDHPDLNGVNHHEQCDDGNQIENDGCTNECTIPNCGNGIVDMGEECDLGSANSDSGQCLTSCHLARCGDNKVEAGVEQCDGTAGPQPCAADCHHEVCGNGIIDPGEQCDDGGTTNGDGCSSTCHFEFCGDGVVNNGEACDPALTPATCNADCTPSSCGDHKVNRFATPAEQCDDGNTTSGDGCSSTCQLEKCGNGVVDMPFEECDGTAGPQPCAADCHHEVCGNGVVDVDAAHSINEQCDNGTTGAHPNSNTGSCTLACKVAICGDNFIETGIEECDNGPGQNADNKDCTADCKINVCGDGKIDSTGTTHEDCDEGNMNGQPGHCDAFCHNPSCGNGFVDIGEQCDPGAGDPNTSTCDNDCTLPACGDGHINPQFTPSGGTLPENCDDGVNNTDDATCPYNTSCTRCSTHCRSLTTVIPTCGDGTVDGPNETCDDSHATLPLVLAGKCNYGTPTCVACNSTCHIQNLVGHFCGDGTTDGSDGETCDDGGATVGETSCAYGTATCTQCDASCHVHTLHGSVCGDSLVDEFNGEDCDGLNLNNNTCLTVPGAFTGGTLHCKSTCKFDTSMCTP